MSINWFPGHMHKARKELKQTLPQADFIIQLLDARLPLSSSNPLINQLAKHKPKLLLLSKADLACPDTTAAWLDYFGQQASTTALPIVATDKNSLSSILTKAESLVDQVRASRSVRALVVGVPNVGKSSLINALVGRPIAKVANQAAITRNQQRIQVTPRLQIIDTPGMLWPKFADENIGYKLAAVGSIGANALDFTDLGFWLAEKLANCCPQALVERYDLDLAQLEQLKEQERLQKEQQTLSATSLAEEIINQVAAKRGGLMAAGRVNFHRASEVLIQDFRNGSLGQISLEQPADFSV